MSNLFRPRATEREYFDVEGHIVKGSLCWGPQHYGSIFQVVLSQILWMFTKKAQ